MDNLTHSLTGALAAKLLATKTAAELDAKQQRAVFWLFVFCANLPDLDVLLGLWGDPIFSTRHHRGLTHSVLFAPLLATLPALLWHRFSPRRSMKTPARFYLVALLGILIHIAFDVITSYGTRLLLPFSETRFALDWMFIVDPFFTAPFALLLACGRFWPKRRRTLVLSAAAFVLGYLSLEVICSRLAHERTHAELRESGIAARRVSVLPQPLSVFKWKALAQTEAAVHQAFFSLWDHGALVFEKFDNASDLFVAAAAATEEVQWYLTFARHPWIRSFPQGEHHVVELTDLQFSVDQALIDAFGASERQLPFVMRFVYSREGDLLRQDFNGAGLTGRAASPLPARENF
jgi:inner membrane protein